MTASTRSQKPEARHLQPTALPFLVLLTTAICQYPDRLLAYIDGYNVAFVAATQPIDTTTPTGKLLLGVLAAVAEFEKALIVERTKEGLAKAMARAQGKRLGRPPGSKDQKKRSRLGYLISWSE